MTLEQHKYLALYPDGHHETIVLGKLLNKGGAAGKIYVDASHEESVAKIFHDRSKSESNRKKLEAMLQNRPNIPEIINKGKKYIQIAWPTALLEDTEGFCVGYLMPLIDTKEAISLDHLMQKAVRVKLGITEKYKDRIVAAYNITSVVAALHACGHYIVDLKPSNVSIYKKTMLVALFDCDGFSIKGENETRYPAEYVSEEYIYPEGMEQACEQMGEEQDKFALAVIIFKLLNEGIHPFSGTPRKNEQMLSIQERIAAYHYAYGIWPDVYQAPHPYSLHDYFDKNTMNLFERAFSKGGERPSALEWQNQLEYIYAHLKTCRKDKNHAYFTAKGCGLCMVAEKFKAQVEEFKKQQEEPQTIRGIDVKSLTVENLAQTKHREERRMHIVRFLTFAALGVYVLFFAFLYPLLLPFKDILSESGVFAQMIAIILGFSCIRSFLDFAEEKLPQNRKFQSVLNMLKIYGYICILIVFIALNAFSLNLFGLAQ